MKSDEIKTAAAKIADLERISQAIKDMEQGSAFAITIGPSTINVPENSVSGQPVRAAVTEFMKAVVPGIEQDLTNLGVEEQDDFDKTLAALDADAQPKGAPN